jgi:transforming growth factor-beta-induced protein
MNLLGIVSVEDIQNEQLLTTNYGNHTIRMNVFPRPPSQEDNEYPYRYTANCVPLTKVNHLTEEGMIHMVERVIQPTTKSVLEIIQEVEILKYSIVSDFEEN